jgi:hypothetical protein
MMSLTDVIKVKKMADNISFFRLFFLKNQRTYIDLRNLTESNISSKENQLDLIDSVLAIYLFEVTRITRSGKHLYRKDQFQYQVLHFFNSLKSCKAKEPLPDPTLSAFSQLHTQELLKNKNRHRIDRIEEESEASEQDSDKELDELISGMQEMECTSSAQSSLQKCHLCTLDTKPSKAFVSLYKHLVNEILKF